VELSTVRREEIKGIVTGILEVHPGTMTLTSHFVDEHDADSMLVLEILAALEKTYNVTIEQSDLGRMVNLQGVYDVVAEVMTPVADAAASR
jgi:acyl carrier protein